MPTEPTKSKLVANLARLGLHTDIAVRQHCWAKRVDLPVGKGHSVSVTCIVAHEVDAPEGVKPVVWRLLTNREVPTLDEMIQLLDWYRARWEIEMFFHIVKNGCRIEVTVISDGSDRTRTCAVYGGVVANCTPDATGSHMSGFRGNTLFSS